jgi:hypothetical protein
MIPRQLTTRSYEGFDLRSIEARIFALENASTAVDGNVFFVKHFGAPSSKLANYLRNLHDRVVALEASSTAEVDFDLNHLPRRAPLGEVLYALHSRLVVLEN